jgi:hypothetical protein
VSEPSALRPIYGPLFRRFGEITVCQPCGEAFIRWVKEADLYASLNTGNLATADAGD